MIRLILALLSVTIFLILGIPVLGILWLVKKWKPMAADLCALRMVQWILKVMLFFCGVKETVIGEDRIPRDQAVLYILNHRSYFDIITTYARVPRRTGYIAKKELRKIPLVPLWMKRLYCLFLDRDDIKQGLQTVLTAIQQINSGISMAVFPEGTRGNGETEADMLPFHQGTFKIAQKTGCPIVPVCISNSSAIFEDHFPRVKAVHVVIEYCEPVYVNQLSPDEKKHLAEYVQEIMRKKLVKNRELI